MEENILDSLAIPCRRCDMDDNSLSIEEIKAQLPQYIKTIDEDIRVTDEEYKSRLELCFICEGLVSEILCKYCGCFVQMRALNKHRHCPNPATKFW